MIYGSYIAVETAIFAQILSRDIHSLSLYQMMQIHFQKCYYGCNINAIDVIIKDNVFVFAGCLKGPS